jgi:hypothetical protein
LDNYIRLISVTITRLENLKTAPNERETAFMDIGVEAFENTLGSDLMEG